MRLSLAAADAAFRRELVAFLEAHCPPEAHATGDFIGAEEAGGEPRESDLVLAGDREDPAAPVVQVLLHRPSSCCGPV